MNRDKGNTTGFNSYKTTVVNFGLRPEIGYESSRPLNLKWQRDMGSTFSWSYQRNHFTGKNSSGGITSESDTFSNVFKTILSAFYGLGYYPNNRSRINANLNVLASYLPYDHSPIKNEISFNPVFSLSTDYFISYRTRLSAYFSLMYEYDVFKQATQPSIRTHLMHAGFGMSVSHSFL